MLRLPIALLLVGSVAVVSSSSAYAVVQAGQYGGQLVHRHGVGINTAAGGITGDAAEARGSAYQRR